VNQAVPAEHHVNPGQRVAGQVEPHEPAIRAGLRVEAGVAFDEFVDDVGTDIAARSQAGLAQPPEVAAGDVENTAGRRLIEESWYLCSKRGRCIQGGADAGHGASAAPEVRPIYPSEQLVERKPAQLCCAFPVPDVGKDGRALAHGRVGYPWGLG